jgi:hypothetical protein
VLFRCFPCKHFAYFNVLLSVRRRKATIYRPHAAAAVVNELGVSYNRNQNALSVLISHVGRLDYDTLYTTKVTHSFQALYNYQF